MATNVYLYNKETYVIATAKHNATFDHLDEEVKKQV